MSTIEPATAKIAVVPYWIEKQQFDADILRKIYRRIVDEELDVEVFHDEPLSEDQFVEFIDSGEIMASIFVHLEAGRIAGLAWLDKVEETTAVKRAAASVVVFRDFWDTTTSIEFGRIFLGHTFNVLGLDVVYGITPEPNRLSRLYIARLGFEHKATLPGFCSYKGQATDARISMITKDQFNSKE